MNANTKGRPLVCTQLLIEVVTKVALSPKRCKKIHRFHFDEIELCAFVLYQIFILISSQNALINANTEKWCDGVPSPSSSRAKGTGSIWIKPFRIGATYGNGYGEVERSTALIRIRR